MKVEKLLLLFNGKGDNGLRYKGQSEALNNMFIAIEQYVCLAILKPQMASVMGSS